MSQRIEIRVAVFLGVLTFGIAAGAQDDPFGDEPIESEGEAPAEEGAAEDSAPPADAPSEVEPAEPEPTTPSVTPAAPVQADAEASVDTSAGAAIGATTHIDSDQTELPAPGAAAPTAPVVTGSHIRRLRLMTADDGLVIDSPLSTEVQGRDYLQTRRQLGGVALPDTTAALGHSKRGAPGTESLELRFQPTLILLNGRRLVGAPFHRNRGSDYVDINQIPITLIERVEITKGIGSGLYGDGAAGGVLNFVTRRDFDGIEVEIGGQATDKFDQHEEDVSLTLGAGSDTTGMTAMVSYFNRQPLAASDRDWIGERENRVESLLGSPASFQQITNYNYPFPDPFCDIAQQAGHATGHEVRIRGYGPPETLNLLPGDIRQEFLNDHDMARGNGDGVLDAYETSTYCAADFTSAQDLVLKDERIQTYSTFWHKFTNHTEAFGELGYYRSHNENRTAPSFPIIRVTPDVNAIAPVWVPGPPPPPPPPPPMQLTTPWLVHADQPIQERGFAAANVATGRVPNNQFIVGRVAGTYAGSNLNKRRIDVWRGVIGLRGDLKEAGAGSVLETWDWELAGVYSSSEAVSSVKDVLMDKLSAALNSCPLQKLDQATREVVPTTIKERQEAGCYNPFYSSVVNSAALNPLGVPGPAASSQNGFVTTDSDEPGEAGYGVQDGGYICDPNDPNSPACPAQFDRDGDGIFELAGTPNTKQVMDRLMGEHIAIQRKELGTADGILRGDLANWDSGHLPFALGAQYRRETLEIDYDAAYNQRLYAFLFGGPDVPNVSRNIASGFAELRPRFANGVVELQFAGRLEHYDDVGTTFSPLAGLMVRPLAGASSPPEVLEWLLFRIHAGWGYRAPSLMQLHGAQTEFHSVEFFGSTHFVPHQIAGNPDLDFEKYTTISPGLQWDFKGLHVGADFWLTSSSNLIAADNAQTLMRDCQSQYEMASADCAEQVLLSGTRTLDHIESSFDNIAEVDTNGIDGGISYTLDTKRRGIGDAGTFVIGVQGTYINSYLIKSPRALREFYRDPTEGDLLPAFNMDGTRTYDNVYAEYEAAGYRNVENFAPAMPKLRLSVPLRWLYSGHVIGATMRYVDGYNDDSEQTVERYAAVLPNGAFEINNLGLAEGEAIPSWVVFDANYGFAFGNDDRRIQLAVGVLNLLDEDPPEVESPLGYEVGIHDPRGRLIYVRLTGAL